MPNRRTSADVGRPAGCALLVVAVLAALVVSPALARAAILHVTVSGDGAGATLRNQIAAAKPSDTVEIDAGVNPTLGGTQIAINESLTIVGHGANQTTVSANNLSRIFKIGSTKPEVTVTIEDLKLTGGRAPDGANGVDHGGRPGGPGGAIISAANVEIADSTITENESGMGGNGSGGLDAGGDGGNGGEGGAIWSSGSLQITNSTLSHNQTGRGGGPGVGLKGGGVGGNGGGGGAIWSSGALQIINSTFSHTRTGAGRTGSTDGGHGSNGGRGGAIRSTGATTIRRSTFADNSTGSGGSGSGSEGSGGNGGGGGAISSAATTKVNNSTFAGNVTGDGGLGGTGRFQEASGGNGGRGGAISSSAALSITNSTLAHNSTGRGGDGGEGGAGGSGGAISASGVNAAVANSILTTNATGPGGRGSKPGSPGAGANCSGSLTDDGHNLAFPTRGGCPATLGKGNPMLDPAGLANNGGPTKTIALQTGSAAINQVPAKGAGCPATDQRGVPRPQGPACDIGAFELKEGTTTRHR
jgi:hypothetical protein